MSCDVQALQGVPTRRHRPGWLLISIAGSLLALALAGCVSKPSVSDETQSGAGLPAVTRLTDTGGNLAVATVNGKQLILSDVGAISVSGGRATLESTVPTGFSLQPTAVAGRFAALLGPFDTVGIWDLSSPDDPPRVIDADDEIAGIMLVDLLGSDTPELVFVATHLWRNTGSPRDNHQRVEVWSLEHNTPERLYRGDVVAEGRVSLIKSVYAIETGLGDERPELLWSQVDATNNKDGDSRLVLVEPTNAFVERTSAAFDRLFEIAGDRQTEGGASLLFSGTFGDTNRDMVIDVRGGTFERDDRPVDASVFTESVHTEGDTMFGGSAGPTDHRGGLTVRRPRYLEEGSPLEVTFADGTLLTLAPKAPILEIRDAWLADIDGDGDDELLVAGDGEPRICPDTSTGYVGWAEREKSGSFGTIVWSDPLGGGIAGLAIADLDGEPGEEVVASMHESRCSPMPADLWIFSP